LQVPWRLIQGLSADFLLGGALSDAADRQILEL